MFIALSLFLPYLFGLGCLVQWVLRRKPRNTGRREDAARDFSLTLLAGILANYSILLTVGHIDRTLVLGTLLAIAGLIIAGRTPGPIFREALRRNWLMAGGVAFLALLYVPHILLDPLSFWDARSIWFFHGRMIFFNGALNEAVGWADPTVAFSLVAYPKLVPGLAAQFAYVAGFWNELFPKAALLAVLIPAILAVFSFIPTPSVSALYLLSAVLFGSGWWLWNGSMDGYLALYAALSTLFVERWLSRGDEGDLYAGFVCLGMVTNLKNEGLLFCLAVAISSVALAATRQPSRMSQFSIFKHLGTWLWLAFSLLGITTWYVLKWKWGITTDPFIRIERLAARLSDGSAMSLINTLLRQNGVAKALALFFIALGLVRAFRAGASTASWLPFMSAILYFTGMTAVYLATPFDLNWHVASSSERTMLTVILALSSGTFTLLKRLEGQDSAAA